MNYNKMINPNFNLIPDLPHIVPKETVYDMNTLNRSDLLYWENLSNIRYAALDFIYCWHSKKLSLGPKELGYVEEVLSFYAKKEIKSSDENREILVLSAGAYIAQTIECNYFRYGYSVDWLIDGVNPWFSLMRINKGSASIKVSFFSYAGSLFMKHKDNSNLVESPDMFFKRILQSMSIEQPIDKQETEGDLQSDLNFRKHADLIHG